VGARLVTFNNSVAPEEQMEEEDILDIIYPSALI
jgi:hypothetical protein